MTQKPKGAHLVGSVPLSDNSAVFATSMTELGNHLHRIPDGETGDRSNWIRWQEAVFADIEELEVTYSDAFRSVFGLKASGKLKEITLPDLGYATAAIDSYSVFADLQEKSQIDSAKRFQVSLPTPLAPVQFYIDASIQAEFEPLYEQKLLDELEQILTTIPHEKLAVQWDTAVEFGVLEGTFPAYFDNHEEAIIMKLIRLGNAVPETVELGFHLCYGDSGHQHFVEPKDTSLLVNIGNAVSNGLNRSLTWLHLPVPRDRTDEAYFAPLENLNLKQSTELYLGLIHMTDGVDGAQQRINAANKFVSDYGIATECGFSRRPAETVAELMGIHASVSDPLNS